MILIKIECKCSFVKCRFAMRFYIFHFGKCLFPQVLPNISVYEHMILIEHIHCLEGVYGILLVSSLDIFLLA